MPFDWTMKVEGSSDIDEQEVRKALSFLVDPNHSVMVQALPSGKFAIVRGGDLDKLVSSVKYYGNEAGCYASLNPIQNGLDRASKNQDVVGRRWLLIDPDAVKPTGRDASTTNNEKDASRLVTEAIRYHLGDLGWPDPIYVDSGNNWQLWYRIDLPNDELSHQIVTKVLRVLADQFDTEDVKVDPAVHDARRIVKIPGTWARKGPNATDRPWRRSKLISVPLPLTVVTVDQLKSLAGIGHEKPTNGQAEANPHADPWTMRGGDKSRSAYVRSVVEREIGRVATAKNPGRNSILHDAAWRIASLVASGELDEQEMRRQLAAAGQACGLGEDGDPNEIQRAIENGFNYGLAHPREIPSRNGKREKASPPPMDPLPRGKHIIWASSVTPTKVQWLWPGYIPLGKMTTFAGRTGLGKTFALCDIASRVTTGREWPFTGGECAEKGKVLFISAEDDIDDTLVPRLIQLGADLSKIAFLSPEADERFDLSALELLTSAVAEMDGDVRFVAIDPPTSYLSGVDDHSNVELRRVLSPLKRWCKKQNSSILFNTHVNKSSGQNVEALQRVMGSVAWVNAVRSAYMFAPDPEDKERRLFLNLKINIGKEPPGLAYQIKQVGNDDATLSWLSQVDMSADEAMNKGVKKTRAKNATEWLIDLFRRQLEWPSELFWSEAKENNISKNAIDEAKARLAIPRARRTVNANGDITWCWWVPADWPFLMQEPPR